MSDAGTCVYFISAGSNPIKIGVSDNPEDRLCTLQTAHYKKLHLLFVIVCTSREDAFKLENAFHRWYQDKRLLNEWFDILPSTIQADLNLLMELAKSAIEFRAVTDFEQIEQLEQRAQAIQQTRAKAKPRVKLREVADLVMRNGDFELNTDEMMSKYGISSGATTAVRKMLKGIRAMQIKRLD